MARNDDLFNPSQIFSVSSVISVVKNNAFKGTVVSLISQPSSVFSVTLW